MARNEFGEPSPHVSGDPNAAGAETCTARTMAATTAPTMLTRVHARGYRQSPTDGAKSTPTKIIPLPNRTIAATRATPIWPGSIGRTIQAMARAATDRATNVLLLHGEERLLILEAPNSTLDKWQSQLVSRFRFQTLEG